MVTTIQSHSGICGKPQASFTIACKPVECSRNYALVDQESQAAVQLCLARKCSLDPPFRVYAPGLRYPKAEVEVVRTCVLAKDLPALPAVSARCQKLSLQSLLSALSLHSAANVSIHVG